MRTHANSAEAQVQRLLAAADIAVDGDRPWDIKVHDKRFYLRVLAGGSLALGESYMDGWWCAEALDAFVAKLLASDIPGRARRDPRVWWSVLNARLFNRQAGARAYHIGQAHYDQGDELFEATLDTRLVYSCAYWKDAETLDQA